MDPLIRLENVSKIYNPRRPDEYCALQDISLTIDKGETVVLQGPSGSGKTSLLSLIGCMARPTAGRIVVAGKDVAKLPERFLTRTRRRVFGFIFQQFNLLRDISVLENVLLPLYPLNTPLAAMQERGREILTRLGIDGKRHFLVRQLSGGEQQRVAIARALINDPDIVIADEPTAHLDSRLAAELLALFGEISSDGRTLLIATHDPLVYRHPLVTRAIAMKDGRTIAAPAP